MLVGVVLLLSPTLLGGFTLGAESYQYGVGYLEPTDDGYEWIGDPAMTGSIDDDVRCWVELSRTCQLERSLLEENVSVDHSEVYYNRHVDYRYVYHDDTFYEAESTGHELWLREVNSTRVFRVTDGEGSEITASAMDALKEGRRTFETHDADLPVHQLVRIEDGRYATLSRSHGSRTLPDDILNMFDPLLVPVGFLAGIVLLLEGYHRRYVGR